MAKATFKCKNCGRILTIQFKLGNKIEQPNNCLCGNKNSMYRIFNVQGLGKTVPDQMIEIAQSVLYH